MKLRNTFTLAIAVCSMLTLSQAGLAQPTLLFPASQSEAVAPVLPQSTRIQFESLLNSSGYEDMASFSQNSKYRRIGSAVGRLKVFAEDGRFSSCTAWLIGPTHVLTNQHCVDATDFMNRRIAYARLEMGVLSNKTAFDIYAVKLPQIESSRELDYAVLEVDASAALKYGHFTLSARDPVDSEELFLIHHPLGQPQSLSRYQCRAAKPAIVGQNVRHLCNTQPGSSGSPIISDNDNALVGLHHAGMPVDIAAAARSNAGIRLSAILESSAVLKSIAMGSTGAPVPGPAPALTSAPAPVPTPEPSDRHAIEVCPKVPDETAFFSVSFDGKSAYGWFKGDACHRFEGRSLGSISRVYIYDVGYWSGQYQADLPPDAPSSRISVCATVLDGAAPDYSFGQLGKFGPSEGCPHEKVAVPFYEVPIGKSGSAVAWRADHVRR